MVTFKFFNGDDNMLEEKNHKEARKLNFSVQFQNMKQKINKEMFENPSFQKEFKLGCQIADNNFGINSVNLGVSKNGNGVFINYSGDINSKECYSVFEVMYNYQNGTLSARYTYNSAYNCKMLKDRNIPNGAETMLSLHYEECLYNANGEQILRGAYMDEIFSRVRFEFSRVRLVENSFRLYKPFLKDNMYISRMGNNPHWVVSVRDNSNFESIITNEFSNGKLNSKRT